MNQLNNNLINSKTINPYFVAGFSDAESSFQICVYKNTKYNTGLNIIPSFSIHLHIKDLTLLYNIQSVFGVGSIHIDKKGESVTYTVVSVKELINVIIPHFNSFPLFTQKRLDFILWSKIVNLMYNKEHLNEKGLQEIISLKASLNNKLPSSLQTAFPNVIPAERG